MRRAWAECGCPACEAMMAVARAIDADLGAVKAATLGGFLDHAAGVFWTRAIRKAAEGL